MVLSPPLRFGLLNLWCFGGPRRRAQQEVVLAAAGLDVVCLLEVDPKDIERFAEGSGFSWWRCSLGADVSGRPLAVAIGGSARVTPQATHQLSVDDFLDVHDGPPIYPELARWYRERHLAVDLSLADGVDIRVGAFHATPATSLGPGRMGVGGRKPWFHTRIADWVATWSSPYLFGIDANTPKVDALAWAQTEFFWPSGRAGTPGEAFLVGPPETVRHRAHDLWREWLTGHPAAGILAQIPPEGPLARSHRLVGGRWCRYDQVWATDDFHLLKMGYDYDLSCSDHALVTASVNIGTADTRQSTARKRRADGDTRVSRGTGRLPGGSRLNR